MGNNKVKNIFIAATRQNDGKTTVSLGLISNFKKRYKEIGFIKPIGQRYLEEDGFKVDEDSVLIEDVCGIKCGIKDMSPVAVEKGFTEKYILHPKKEAISGQIKEAYGRVAENKDLVVIEGTGHAGVGSVFDHSNAYVAKLLDSKVILVSSGGIGRPIDEILLNKALFDAEGVELLGVIVNKVMPDKFDKIAKLVRQGLKRKGIEVLGVLPYHSCLSAPTISQIIEETGFELLSGKEGLNNIVVKIIVGAMGPHEAFSYISDRCLVITPGDREDIIMTALNCHMSGIRGCIKVSGIVLSGGIMPHPTVVGFANSANVPLMFSKLDTYKVASIIHDLTVKIRPTDKDKIEEVVGLIEKHVDLEKISDGM
ncbi:MAG: AAA family ATPase [Candidatus Omnitrophota bacterium]|nr:AAA family ATPase [Candidatus Omnitrophota bacterium]